MVLDHPIFYEKCLETRSHKKQWKYFKFDVINNLKVTNELLKIVQIVPDDETAFTAESKARKRLNQQWIGQEEMMKI